MLFLAILENLWTPITTFLFFNVFAALGNLITEWIRKVCLFYWLKKS